MDTKGHVIEGERIYLRDVESFDVNEKYCLWMRDKEINKYLETRFVDQTRETILDYVSSMQKKTNVVYSAICLKSNDSHIGNIKLGPIVANHNRAKISLMIGEKECWGQGYAKEAILLITRFGFEYLNLTKIEAGIYEVNEGSINAFLSSGFSIEGRLNDSINFNGKLIQVVVMGLTKREWVESKKV